MKQETSCVNTKAILDYFDAHHGGDYTELIKDLHPELNAVSNAADFLKDPNNWVSCDVIATMYERAKRLLDNPDAPFQIARHAMETKNLGFNGLIVRIFGSFGRIIKNLPRINARWNRNKVVEVVSQAKGQAVVRLHWDPTMAATKDICRYNQGCYVYARSILGRKPVTLTETSCFFDGAPYCEYQMHWQPHRFLRSLFSRLNSSPVQIDTLNQMEQDKALLEKKYAEVNDLNVELHMRIQQLLAVQETGKAILSILELKPLLEVVMNILFNLCRVHRAVILLMTEDRQMLRFAHGVGFSHMMEAVERYRVPVDRVSNLLARVASTGKAEYIPDVSQSRLNPENILLHFGNPKSVYALPLISRGQVIGVLATDAVDDSGVPENVRETLDVISPQIATAIENARLYTALQSKMDELQRSQTLLSRVERFSFLGNVAARLAHEIKNPLTAIGTFLQMLPDKFDDPVFRNEFHPVALEETVRVNHLISELLNLVAHDDPHFADSELHALIDKMVMLVSPQSRAKRITIHREYDPTVGSIRMDAERMKQVFLNLLSNAVEALAENQHIEVKTTAEPTANGNQWIRVDICDTGPGIPPEIIDKIFDPYFTTKHKSTIHKGTGLGLFIAHQHILAHGGTIDINPASDKGAHFILRLPADDSNTLRQSRERE